VIVDVLAVGPIQANCYVLGCPETLQALVIDPGDEPDEIAACLERHRLVPKLYLHTHGHMDHVGATAVLKQRLGGEILLHAADLFLYRDARVHAAMHGIEIPPTLPVDREVSDGDELLWGRMRGRILHTPGHSPGGVCLRVPAACMQGAATGRTARASSHPAASGARIPSPPMVDWLFTGDTLFQSSVGRTDLPGGSWTELLRSIREKLLSLPGDCVVAPGHGPMTTIGRERRDNPFLQHGIEIEEEG